MAGHTGAADTVPAPPDTDSAPGPPGIDWGRVAAADIGSAGTEAEDIAAVDIAESADIEEVVDSEDIESAQKWTRLRNLPPILPSSRWKPGYVFA